MLEELKNLKDLQDNNSFQISEDDEDFVLPLSEQLENKKIEEGNSELTDISENDKSSNADDVSPIEDVSVETTLQENFPDENKENDKFDKEKYVERLRKKNDAIKAERQARETLQKENIRLRELAEQAQQIAAFNASDAIEGKIKHVMQKQRQALDESDYEAHTQCALELNELSNQKSEIEKMKAQYKIRQEQLQTQYNNQNSYQNQQNNNYQQQNQQQEYQHQTDQGLDDDEEPVNENLVNWVHKTPWANPNKREFNQRMVNDVAAYSVILDNQLEDSGRSHLIGTPQYFKTIDKYVDNRYFKNKSPVLAKSSHSVAPVKSSAGSSPVSKNYNLTEAEKRMAKNFGMSQKEYYDEIINLTKGKNTDE